MSILVAFSSLLARRTGSIGRIPFLHCVEEEGAWTTLAAMRLQSVAGN